jgi:hypothetical protein
MKYIKTYESFSVNETMDMMFMPVDPIAKMGDVYSGFYKEIKSKIKSFFDAIKKEGDETKEAFDLVVKASKGEIELTEDQKNKIWTQLKDVFKTIGLTASSILPGGSLVFFLIKFLKAEKHTLPSSFL